MATLIPIEGDPFAQAPRVPQASSTPQLIPLDKNPFESVPSAAQAAPESGDEPVGPQLVPLDKSPFEGQTQETPSDHWAVTRGLVSGFTQSNPELGAEALEMYSHLAPDALKEPLLHGSAALRGTAGTPKGYELKYNKISDAWKQGYGPTLSAIGEQFGSGLASSFPGLVTGAAGAGAGFLAGGAVGGPPGAAAGLTLGSYLGAVPASHAMNSAEVYKALKDEKIPPEEAAKIASAVGAPMAALDSFSAGRIIQALGGADTVKREATKNLAKRIAIEYYKGGRREGLTETAQEAIKDYTVSLQADKPFWNADNVEGMLTSGLVGGLTGGVMEAPAGLRRPKLVNTPVTDEDISRVYAGSVGTPGGAPVRGPEPPSIETLASKAMPRDTGAEEPKWYYSQVRRVAEEKLPNAGTAEQMLATLENTPGVKPEEIGALGLRDWAERNAGQRVTKQDLLSEIESNAVQVNEVRYGNQPPLELNFETQTRNTQEDETWRKYPQADRVWNTKEAPGWRIVRYNGVFDVINPRGYALHEALPNLEAAQGALYRELTPPSSTQYQDYTLGRGRGLQNYREVLLTLPRREGQSDPVALARFDELNKKEVSGATLSEAELREYENLSGRLNQIESGGDNYQSGHWDPQNVLAHTRISDRTDATGKKTLFVEEVQSDWHQAGRERGYKGEETPPVSEVERIEWTGPGDVSSWSVRFADGKESTVIAASREQAQEAAFLERKETVVPQAPFKTSWRELLVKRILKIAVDEGYERVTFPPSEVAIKNYPGLTKEQIAGLKESYDVILPSVVGKLAKKFGGKSGTVQIKYKQSRLLDNRPTSRTQPLVDTITAPYIEITDAMREKLATGVPLFSKKPQGERVGTGVTFNSLGLERQGTNPQILAAARQAAIALVTLARRMGITKPIEVRYQRDPENLGLLTRYHNEKGVITHYVLSVDPTGHRTAAEVYATVAHEFGHLVMHEKFSQADKFIKLGVHLEHETWRNYMRGSDSFQELVATRDNMVVNLNKVRGADRSIAGLTPERRRYWLSFDEWFAEQVARWATTSEKPLSVLDKFFSSLAKKLREVHQFFRMRFAGQYTATPEQFIGKWLDSLVGNTNVSYFEVLQQMEAQTRRVGANVFKVEGVKNFPAVGETMLSQFSRKATRAAVGDDGDLGAKWKASAAAVDRFGKGYALGLGVTQVADRNPHIIQLQRYRELWQAKSLERHNIMNDAHATIKLWRKLDRTQADSVSGLIDDYMNMKYLRPNEIAAKVARRPTEEEFRKLVHDNKVSSQGIAVFQQIVKDFDSMLSRYGQILIEASQRITDPNVQAQALASISEHIAALRRQPYFPAMRFGDFTLTVRDAAGHVLHFETFETKAKRRGAERIIKSRLGPDETIHLGILPKEAKPLIGIPPRLLEMMGEKLNLDETQRAALEQLRFEMAPAQSFKHRFQTKNRTPGYSSDFMRAYANYFFHGSNYFTNLRYVDQFRDQVLAVKQSAREMADGTKRGMIANFMEEHLNYNMDPKADFSILRSLGFLWFLGYSPAAAALNLSQMAIGSYPFMASKFGDVRTVAAMTRAGVKLSTYYKRGRLENMDERELRALSEGVREGVITEAMAPELAAISEGRNLLKGTMGGAASRGWLNFMEGSSKMFELSEQVNRRVTFRAAFDLASQQPNSRYVREMVEKHSLQYQRLRDAGWTERDAGAFVAAKDTVESTQYIYQEYARPKFMRGHLKTVFIFKTFIQNTLFMLWNYPTAAARSLLIMAFLGGAMGMPGADDIKGIAKLIARRLFGSDFDLEKEARRFVLDVLDEKVPPDLVLHGMSRYGFGIPQAMEMMGVPFPTLDRSKSIGLGQISPVDFGAFAGDDTNRTIAEQGQRASGAVFGAGVNIYRALTDGALDWNDFKRWEKAMPRFASSVSRSYRAFAEGRERDRTGATVVKYDVTDTTQMMEALAMAGGYTPLRASAQWDRRIAEMETVQFWNTRREGLLRQLWTARGDKETYQEVLGAIRKFNEGVRDTPAAGKAITADVVKRSFQTRARSTNARESGVPRVRGDIPLVRDIQRLYPEAEVDVRVVK